jgi:hypothetical protein
MFFRTFYNKPASNFYYFMNMICSFDINKIWYIEIPGLSFFLIFYRGSQYVKWDREVDSYYPRDKYNDVTQYFGQRYYHICLISTQIGEVKKSKNLG